ncbi:MAG TPA: hypothetical protein VFB00_00535, partial [Terriglobales bacterium]|nr:hypothetical protein [Terriglobales bacterium]
MEKPSHQFLLGLDQQELTQIAEREGEPSYRARQMFQAIYRDWVSSPEQISTLPKEFRSALARAGIEVGLPAMDREFLSRDGTVRYLVRLADGETVETVWMPEGDDGEAGDGSEAGAEIESGSARAWRRA